MRTKAVFLPFALRRMVVISVNLFFVWTRITLLIKIFTTLWLLAYMTAYWHDTFMARHPCSWLTLKLFFRLADSRRVLKKHGQILYGDELYLPFTKFTRTVAPNPTSQPPSSTHFSLVLLPWPPLECSHRMVFLPHFASTIRRTSKCSYFHDVPPPPFPQSCGWLAIRACGYELPPTPSKTNRRKNPVSLPSLPYARGHTSFHLTILPAPEASADFAYSTEQH